MFQTKFVEKMKTHILCSVASFIFRKSCRLWHNVEKHCRAGQATDDNMAHARCILDTLGFNIYHFSTATMVRRTRLSVHTFPVFFNDPRFWRSCCWRFTFFREIKSRGLFDTDSELLYRFCLKFNRVWMLVGHALAQLFEALRYKPEGRGFDSRWCH